MLKGYLKDSRNSIMLMVVCFITYTVICMTKTTYSTAIAAIVSEGLFTKSSAGTINAFFMLFYGATQLVGGVIADKKSPFIIVIIALIGSLLSNIVMAYTESFTVMLIAWSFNGFIQFGLWPSMIKIVSTVLHVDYRRKAMVLLSFGFTAGAVLSYLVATVLLKWFRWPSLFKSSAIVLILTLILFVGCLIFIKDKLVNKPAEAVTQRNESKQEQGLPLFKIILSSGVIFMLVPAAIRSMLHAALNSWSPTIIMESYNTTPEFASLLTAVLLVVNLTGVFFVEQVYPRRSKNLIWVIAMFMMSMLPMLLTMVGVGYIPIAIIVICIALITTITSAGNQLFNVILPSSFYAYGKTGSIAGIVNAFACFGSFIANIVFGYTSDLFGWNITAILWIALDGLAIILTFLAIPKWKKFMKLK